MDIDTGTLMLTSDGLTTQTMLDKVIEASTKIQQKNVAIITTASKGKEENPYSQKTAEQFQDMNFDKIDFVDFETNPAFDFSPYDVIYVCGGNTFKLLHFARKENFVRTVEKLLERKGIYIGVSAGSIIATPSMKFVRDFQFDDNTIGLTDFRAMNLIPQHVFVHYTPKLEETLSKYEDEQKMSFIRITNEQAVVIENNTVKII